MQEGTRISREELKLRWAFAEWRTDRWRAAFSAFPSELIRRNVPFAELTREERLCLSIMIERCRKNLVAELDRADVYQCEAWGKDQLARTYTIPRMSPSRTENIPFLSFLACPRFDQAWDPRVQADAIPFDTPFVQVEPVIVLPDGRRQILVEGYLRSVLFMRGRDLDQRILVWRPGA